MVLPASASEAGELMAKNPCVSQSSYPKGSVTTSKASITGEAVALFFLLQHLCCLWLKPQRN